MKRLKQVENKHIKILDQQGMKFVRYVVFDESPLLMIITLSSLSSLQLCNTGTAQLSFCFEGRSQERGEGTYNRLKS